ncbi:Transcriptional regulator YqjI [Dermatophilus congolensis]|uniref:Transcriptional regulator YqjI n=1 Tax=Dermatophilus congolensis TaxID=1863 RepID=A0AA46H0S6_9MICO|nr:PadR family transcriptional regulator [Dermatophilus congolensis]STD11481.1 Transcriptional regulator YqjI [Dermatophilus congolensis]
MASPVFGHGQLRLYLLAVLDEGGPMSGYDIIQVMERRFRGLYSPSAGTIYPRLAKLEDEGLLTRRDEGRKSIYTLTNAGREELDSRSEELEGLRAHVTSSSEQLTDELHRRMSEGAAHLTSLFGAAAAAWENQTRSATAQGSSRSPLADMTIEGIERLARDFRRGAAFTEHTTPPPPPPPTNPEPRNLTTDANHHTTKSANISSEQVNAIITILRETADRLEAVLEENPQRHKE